MRYIFLALILMSTIAYTDSPKQVFVFPIQKAACSLIDGKLVLSKMWPLGSWEECAYSILSAAQQLDQQKDLAEKQLKEERAKPTPACLGPVLSNPK